MNKANKPSQIRTAEKVSADFYPTPAWATYALLFEVGATNFYGRVWEPACGNGAMSEVLKSKGLRVISTDLYDRGYGKTGIDFLTNNTIQDADHIITNPPFNLAEQFLETALKKARKSVCLLLRLSFLEGSGRYKSIFNVNPPTKVLVFSERITFYPDGVQTKGTGTTSYAWFIWDKQYYPEPVGTEIMWTEPGLKAKYKDK